MLGKNKTLVVVFLIFLALCAIPSLQLISAMVNHQENVNNSKSYSLEEYRKLWAMKYVEWWSTLLKRWLGIPV